MVAPGTGSDARPMGPDSRTISIRTGSRGIRAPHWSHGCMAAPMLPGFSRRATRAPRQSSEVVRAVVLAVVGDECRIEVRVGAGWGALVRLEVDRTDEGILAADLAQLLYAPNARVGLPRRTAEVGSAGLVDGHGAVVREI